MGGAGVISSVLQGRSIRCGRERLIACPADPGKDRVYDHAESGYPAPAGRALGSVRVERDAPEVDLRRLGVPVVEGV